MSTYKLIGGKRQGRDGIYSTWERNGERWVPFSDETYWLPAGSTTAYLDPTFTHNAAAAREVMEAHTMPDPGPESDWT